MAALTSQDIEKSRKIFTTFDKDDSGTIDVQELRAALQLLGQQPTTEELFIIISQVDQDRSGTIDFKEFLSVIEKQKAEEATNVDEAFTVEAFVAMGGKADKSGVISVDKLKSTILLSVPLNLTAHHHQACPFISACDWNLQVCKEFDLAIDVNALLAEPENHAAGTIDFAEFKALLGD